VSIETICADCGLDVGDLEDGHCGWSVCPYRARERRGEKPPSTDETRVRLQRAGSGAAQIAAERERQITGEGWDGGHDDAHTDASLPRAAMCYAGIAALVTVGGSMATQSVPAGWPWEDGWWKPSADPIRNLVKAGALIAAEIDRLDRERARHQNR
jgi:hypothetical protein